MPKFSYDTHLKIMRCQKKDKTAVDGTAYVVGVITMLRQFNSLYTEKFLAYLGQYVRSFINVTLGADEKMKMQDYPPEVLNVLLFLEAFCLHSNRSRKSVEGYLPAYIFDEFKH
ncbi:WASH complex subunit strumpellin [Balamuthia mandrillaris]